MIVVIGCLVMICISVLRCVGLLGLGLIIVRLVVLMICVCVFVNV